MAKREIPKDQWHSYLDDLNHRSARHLVTVEVDGKTLAERVPFSGVEPEEKGSFACAFDIFAGSEETRPPERTTHFVRCPTRLLVEENERGEAKEIDIEGETPEEHAKIKTIIRFVE